MHPCVHVCVVCLVKDSGQQGTGWVQSRREEDYGVQFLLGGSCWPARNTLCVHTCVCVLVGGGHGLSLTLIGTHTESCFASITSEDIALTCIHFLDACLLIISLLQTQTKTSC